MKTGLRNFEPGIELRNRMERLREEPSEENRLHLIAALEVAELFVISSPEDGGLALLHTSESEALLPAFSIRHELAKWPFAKGGTCTLPFMLLRQVVIKSGAELRGLLIDPFGTPVLLRREELMKMSFSTDSTSKESVRTRRTAELRLEEP